MSSGRCGRGGGGVDAGRGGRFGGGVVEAGRGGRFGGCVVEAGRGGWLTDYSGFRKSSAQRAPTSQRSFMQATGQGAVGGAAYAASNFQNDDDSYYNHMIQIGEQFCAEAEEAEELQHSYAAQTQDQAQDQQRPLLEKRPRPADAEEDEEHSLFAGGVMYAGRAAQLGAEMQQRFNINARNFGFEHDDRCPHETNFGPQEEESEIESVLETMTEEELQSMMAFHITQFELRCMSDDIAATSQGFRYRGPRDLLVPYSSCLSHLDVIDESEQHSFDVRCTGTFVNESSFSTPSSERQTINIRAEQIESEAFIADVPFPEDISELRIDIDASLPCPEIRRVGLFPGLSAMRSWITPTAIFSFMMFVSLLHSTVAVVGTV
eukprot:3219106-Rhodomonas_salina.1